MNTNLRALQAQILATPACQPHIITNDMPRVPSQEALPHDQAIADIISAGRTRLVSNAVNERGLRSKLTIAEGALFVKTLRELQAATSPPVWLFAALQKEPKEEIEAYLDTLQCCYPWLQSEGLDVGDETVRLLLDVLAAGIPALAPGVSKLKRLGEETDPVSVSEVSLALRGPWGDE